MNKIEIIARRILGWKLNGSGKWYDSEKNMFIHPFEPEENLEDAMLIVDRLIELGFSYSKLGETEVCFDKVCETGETLAHAITNAAFSIADNRSVPDEWL